MALIPRQEFNPPLHEPALARQNRRAQGIYFTPPEVAEFLAQRTLAALPPNRRASPRVLDLACGAGALLRAIGRELRHQGCSPAQLAGIDPEESAIAAARQELSTFACDLQVGDGLFAELRPPRQFDAIVGNPPFINIRQAAKNWPADRQSLLTSRFRFARGSYDLSILFCERSWELLAPGGVLGLILPDKFGSAEYAAGFRRLLLDEATILEIHDIGQERVFRQAAIYPWVVIVRKQRATAGHCVQFASWSAIGAGPHHHFLQRQLAAEAFAFSSALDVEERAPTSPFGSRATLACGATGYRAKRLSELLSEATQVPETLPTRPFIVSGSIDPFIINREPVRFQRRIYMQPVIQAGGGLSAHQRALFGRQKLVIAGLAQRIEAAWDEVGRALGVQVFAAYALSDDPYYLLGLLNSQLLSAIYRQRFGSRRLAGGYLTFNKGPLSKLPIRRLDDSSPVERRRAREIATAAKELHSLGVRSDLGAFHSRQATLVAEIDAAVLSLYRVFASELADGAVAATSAAA